MAARPSSKGPVTIEMTDREPLNHERVVIAAVAFVDDYGLEALSMRKLGAELGVEAMSLYNHVANKDTLLDDVLDFVLREIELPDRSLSWDSQLRVLAHAFRRAGLRHPGVLPLFGQRAIRSVEGFAPLERAYDILRSAGLDPDDALDAFITASSYVLGFVQTELGGLRDVAEGRSIDFSMIDLGEHPRLVEMGVAFANRDGAREFEFGLDLIIQGVELRIAGYERHGIAQEPSSTT